MRHKKLHKILQIALAGLMVISIHTAASAEPDQDSTWQYNSESQTADASDLALPMLSLLLPGAGQWARGQWTTGAIYSSLALGSAAYAANAKRDYGDQEIKFSSISEDNVAARKYLLGLQTSQAIGGISLYHTFRSAVWQRQKFGEYGFLGIGASPMDLIKAPFRFDVLTRSSTYIPLSIVGLASLYLATHPQQGYVRKQLTQEDPWFAGAYSFNAGVHEEAVFRGWLMPVMKQYGLSDTWTNIGQAGVFALAHIGSTPLPLPQFFLALHLGRTTMNSQWQLRESIFIHTWWDVMVFLATYHSRKGDQTSQSPATLNLPPIQLFF